MLLSEHIEPPIHYVIDNRSKKDKAGYHPHKGNKGGNVRVHAFALRY